MNGNLVKLNVDETVKVAGVRKTSQNTFPSSVESLVSSSFEFNGLAECNNFNGIKVLQKS